MEHVSANELPNGHGEVGDQSNASDPYTGVMFVRGSQVDIVMVVVVVVVAVTVTVTVTVAVTSMASGL